MSDKIPIEVLLKYSRQEVGELKSYIQELEEENKKLKHEIICSKNVNKAAKVEVRKEELYIELKNQLKSLQEKLRTLHKDKDRLIHELSKYKIKYGNTL